MHSTSIFTSLLLAALSSSVIATPAIGAGMAPVIRPMVGVEQVGTISSDKCGVTSGANCTNMNLCCSASGTCGTTMGHCGEGCQQGYGTCGMGNVDKFPAGAPTDKLTKSFKHNGKTKGNGRHNGTQSGRPEGPTGTRSEFPHGTNSPHPYHSGGPDGPDGRPPNGPPPTGTWSGFPHGTHRPHHSGRPDGPGGPPPKGASSTDPSAPGPTGGA